MGAKSALSVEQYLHTSFPDLDKEYRDGELVERSLPTFEHGETQLRIGAFFAALRKSHSLHAAAETRMRIRTGLYLIPDVAVFQGVRPASVPDNPPLIAIEILPPMTGSKSSPASLKNTVRGACRIPGPSIRWRSDFI